ncbi:MAG: metal-dependent hydrolase [Gemmatimonadota bacterium]|nr:MAG: metal-dependent hydrolase [Gemmatimonadota bacterium]
MPRLTFHGHSCFVLESNDGTTLLIDPFLTGNPIADIGPGDLTRVDYVLFSHGHEDHIGDGFEIAQRTGAMVVSTFEIVSFAQQVKGIENAHPLHIGGGHDFAVGRIKMTPALHGGAVAGDDTGQFTTVPGGFLITLDGKTVYHAGDTALITDMQLLKGQVDVACLPIGDNFTMGPDDAVKAVAMIEPRTVIPMHYNTFDIIAQDPRAFARSVGASARVEILEPGQSYEF